MNQIPLFSLGEYGNDWCDEWINMPSDIPDFFIPTRDTEARNKINVDDIIEYCLRKTSRLPKYPIYVISKGRWEYNFTSKALDELDIPHFVVVEPCEQDRYSSTIAKGEILVLPDNFSEAGMGSIPVRNWVWEHSLINNNKRHWIIDDNIKGFGIQKGGRRVNSRHNGDLFSICETFTDRYSNIGLAGIRYRFHHNYVKAPYLANTRIYSCILVNNSLSERWRGKYNEDTDLSLRILKSGLSTILFTWCYCNKIASGKLSGGNTDTIYNNMDNRKEFAESLQKQHPDVVGVVQRFGRWHHQVDYSSFKKNRMTKEIKQ